MWSPPGCWANDWPAPWARAWSASVRLPTAHPSATSLRHPGAGITRNGHVNGNGSRQPRIGAIPSTTVVTVERVPDRGPLPGALVPLALRRPDPGETTTRLRHRTVIRYSTRRLAGYGTRHDDHRPNGDHPLGAVLVVDPDPTVSGSPGLAALGHHHPGRAPGLPDRGDLAHR